MIPARDLSRALAWTLALLAPPAALALALGFAFGPEAVARGTPWHLLGLEAPTCPGCALCGMTRAFSALAHGDLDRALALHPAVMIAWPLAWLVALGGPLLLARALAPRRASLPPTPTPRRRTCRSPR